MNKKTQIKLLNEFRELCENKDLSPESKLKQVTKYIESGVYKIKKPGKPFFEICKEGNLDLVLYFLENCPDRGNKLLHLNVAVEYACLLGHIEMLEYFIDEGVPLQSFRGSMSESVKKWWVTRKLKGI